jgi:hypothetical protein
MLGQSKLKWLLAAVHEPCFVMRRLEKRHMCIIDAHAIRNWNHILTDKQKSTSCTTPELVGLLL